MLKLPCENILLFLRDQSQVYYSNVTFKQKDHILSVSSNGLSMRVTVEKRTKADKNKTTNTYVRLFKWIKFQYQCVVLTDVRKEPTFQLVLKTP